VTYNQGLKEKLKNNQSGSKKQGPNFFENISRNSFALARNRGNSSVSSRSSYKQTIGNAERKSFFEFE
jgi:hypothetical protein